MARLNSIAIGGYFPTPAHLLPKIARLIKPTASTYTRSYMDPCAGEGTAIHEIASKAGIGSSIFYGCEMESLRFEGLKQKFVNSWNAKLLQGDAFRITYDKGAYKEGISLLYLNPPYDTDKVYGRLEHKFLERFSDALAENGLLLFVVPFYAIKASAEFIAKNFVDVVCLKFPEPDFSVYKQVVLAGKKRPSLFQPNPILLSKLLECASDPSSLETLDEAQPFYDLPSKAEGLDSWKINPIDLLSIRGKIRHWQQTTKKGQYTPVPNTIPDSPIQDLLLRSYPLATPPRPAHIAAGIASGIFNGSQLEPNPGVNLPKLLVKGAFDREFITVDEKHDKDGNVKALVQVQQPKLVISILDLESYKYHTLKSGTEVATTVEELNLSNLIACYGDSMIKVMEKQCPMLYDPRRDSDSITLAESARKPFTAQAHAIKALVKLLGGVSASKKQRQHKGAILLGEIGAGKSSVALLTAKTIQSKRPLVICPPHLLDTWESEARIVTPEAEVRVIRSIADLEDLAKQPLDRTIISVLSRETAKLGYGWAGVEGKCPKCYSPVPDGELAKKRARCTSRKVTPKGRHAKAVRNFAEYLVRYAPDKAEVTQLLDRKTQYKTALDFNGLTPQRVEPLAKIALAHLDRLESQTILAICCHYGLSSIIHAVAGENRRALSRSLIHHLPEGVERDELYDLYSVTAYDDLIRLDKTSRLDLALKLLTTATSLVKFTLSPPCDEFLYQAVPEPRRIALADHITRYYRDTFDLLILDEAHEFANENAAQGRAAHRIQNLGLPTILQTGSIMNGYADSMFTNLWYTSSKFREEFTLEDSSKFVDRYGYRKRVVEDRDANTGKVVEFGSTTDRVVRSIRVTGNAPGVLPLFILKHLLPVSVTLHKADLAIDLPPCKMEKFVIEPSIEIADNYAKLRSDLVSRIKADCFKPERSGKLFGQLAELPSYPDRATRDTGNTSHGAYEIRYPETVGSELVSSVDGLPESMLLPKEAWLLDKIQAEIAEGRRVMILTWHVSLLDRISKLVSHRIGEPVPVLYSNKVPTGKRKAWIDKEVVAKKRKVMVTNPLAVQTGLNVLVHFSTQIWLENPACNSTIYRQAIGRVDRIGQKLETRILFPVYKDTLQEQVYDLLLKKVSVSISTDGLDPEAAIEAAGGGAEDFLAGLSLGKQLWNMIKG